MKTTRQVDIRIASLENDLSKLKKRVEKETKSIEGISSALETRLLYIEIEINTLRWVLNS